MAAVVSAHPTVGWVYAPPGDPAAIEFSLTAGAAAGQHGVAGEWLGASTTAVHHASTRYTFVGALQPSSIEMPKSPPPPPPPPPPLTNCDFGGSWIQTESGQMFNITVFPANISSAAATGSAGNAGVAAGAEHGTDDSKGSVRAFALNISAADQKQNGWLYGAGTLASDNASFKFAYWRPSSSRGSHGWIKESGRFVFDCAHILCSDSSWHRPGAPPLPPPPPPPPGVIVVPVVKFDAINIPANTTLTMQIVLSIGDNSTTAATLEKTAASNQAAFTEQWTAAHDKWEERWQQVFTPNNGFFSGHLPIIDLESSGSEGAGAGAGDNDVKRSSSNSTTAAAVNAAAGVSRVYWMTILTVITQLRTNLPHIFPRVFVNGQGNLGGVQFGVGGARSWWWDEALTSLMLAMLEPAGRAPTMQAWLAHDQDGVFGHGLGNGYAMDCPVPGSESCQFPSAAVVPVEEVKPDKGAAGAPKHGANRRSANATTASRFARAESLSEQSTSTSYAAGGGSSRAAAIKAPQYGFYCYNPWAFFMTMSNHLRLNNDTAFLNARAASTNKTVLEALEAIATDWQNYLIPGTMLVDYGPAMDGFSPTYKHVMPGCSQGNNVWMLREMARTKEALGDAAEAARLRGFAASMSAETLDKTYTSSGEGTGWFNVIFPPSGTGDDRNDERDGGAAAAPAAPAHITAAAAAAAAAAPITAAAAASLRYIGNHTATSSYPYPTPRVPSSAAASKAVDHVVAYEMRHVVDFFSVTFGLCGHTDQLCDFSPRIRAELGDWFRKESVTSTWIRATSPKCNCSHTWAVPIRQAPTSSFATTSSNNDTENNAGSSSSSSSSNNNKMPTIVGSSAEEYPAYDTCKAGRPDHGSNGAYPSWPAFSCEALCYVDGNCSSAFSIMATFADNTYEGPFGQAHEVPQSMKAPYTPYNDEKAFKPIAGVTRYIGIEGGSFFDAILRGFFGYHPPMVWGAGDADVELKKALLNPTQPRGFKGQLQNVRTPFGLATLTSSDSGVSIALQK